MFTPSEISENSITVQLYTLQAASALKKKPFAQICQAAQKWNRRGKKRHDRHLLTACHLLV
jgi:hypothetical protein